MNTNRCRRTIVMTQEEFIRYQQYLGRRLFIIEQIPPVAFMVFGVAFVLYKALS